MDKIIQFSSFLKFPNIFHCISQKSDGNLKLKKNLPNYEIIFSEEQNIFFTAQNILPSRTIFMEQVHGTEVVSCDKDCAGHWVPEVDGLVTTEKNLFLCVNTADCVPLFFYEPVNQIIGIAHAGWRGTLGEIGKKVVERLIEKHGGKIENILVGIGPSICGKCYEVDKERFDRKDYLDLKGINAKILIDAGIKPENIEISPYCTSCNNDKFYSYRKNRNKKYPLEIDIKKDYGEMVGVIGIKSEKNN